MPKQLEIEVKQSLKDLYELQNSQNNRTLSNRVQMLILLKTKDFKYITELADSLPFSLTCIKGWVKVYKTNGLEALLSDDRGDNRQAAISGEVYKARSLIKRS